LEAFEQRPEAVQGVPLLFWEERLEASEAVGPHEEGIQCDEEMREQMHMSLRDLFGLPLHAWWLLPRIHKIMIIHLLGLAPAGYLAAPDSGVRERIPKFTNEQIDAGLESVSSAGDWPSPPRSVASPEVQIFGIRLKVLSAFQETV
jgi:hypothetical protein